MDFTLAKRFAAAVREVFPDATSDSAEDGDEIWVAKDAVYDPELDQRFRAQPDFHDWAD